jgi:hypothetical protein
MRPERLSMCACVKNATHARACIYVPLFVRLSAPAFFRVCMCLCVGWGVPGHGLSGGVGGGPPSWWRRACWLRFTWGWVSRLQCTACASTAHWRAFPPTRSSPASPALTSSPRCDLTPGRCRCTSCAVGALYRRTPLGVCVCLSLSLCMRACAHSRGPWMPQLVLVASLLTAIFFTRCALIIKNMVNDTTSSLWWFDPVCAHAPPLHTHTHTHTLRKRERRTDRHAYTHIL